MPTACCPVDLLCGDAWKCGLGWRPHNIDKWFAIHWLSHVFHCWYPTWIMFFSQTTQPFSNCPHTCCKSMILDLVCEHDGAILASPSSTATISSSVRIPAASAFPLLPSVLKELSWYSLSESTSSNASSKVTIPCLSLLSLLIRWDLAKAFLDINLPFFLTEGILPPTNKMCLHLKG